MNRQQRGIRFVAGESRPDKIPPLPLQFPLSPPASSSTLSPNAKWLFSLLFRLVLAGINHFALFSCPKSCRRSGHASCYPWQPNKVSPFSPTFVCITRLTFFSPSASPFPCNSFAVVITQGCAGELASERTGESIPHAIAFLKRTVYVQEQMVIYTTATRSTHTCIHNQRSTNCFPIRSFSNCF